MTFRAGKRTCEGRTRNVSRGGLCATLVDPIPVGVDVELDLVLVFSDQLQSDALRVPARVVWCTPLDEAHQIGVAFRPMEARRAEQLDVFLQYLKEHPGDKPAGKPSVDDRFR